MSEVKVALIQQQNTENNETNLQHSISAIQTAATQGAQLIVLQELHKSLYFCQTEDKTHFSQAETIPGKTTDRLAKIAKQYNTVIVASVFEKTDDAVYYNTAVVLDSDGSIAGCYRKMHIPYDPSYYEKFYFTEGNLGFKPIQTSVGCLGVMVCFDQWFPEAARLMALNGAEILIYPTAIGWDISNDINLQQRELDAWITVQRGHAIANVLPLISCNRSGFEAEPGNEQHGINFWGNSFICGPQGEILAQAASDDAEILHATIDLKRSAELRKVWTFFRDRRNREYTKLTDTT